MILKNNIIIFIINNTLIMGSSMSSSISYFFASNASQQLFDYQNDCNGEPIIDSVCIELYDPVCGCNGETYSNSCFAISKGIKNWSDGECK